MDEFDRIDFEAHVGLPITEEQFEAFKLLYQSGCFTDWQDFARKAWLIVQQLYLPGTECCLEKERHRLEVLYRNLPYGYTREDVLELYLFLYSLRLWHTSDGVIFRNEYVTDYMLEILEDIDGVCIFQQDGYAAAELDIETLAAFCKALENMRCDPTGRLRKEANDGEK